MLLFQMIPIFQICRGSHDGSSQAHTIGKYVTSLYQAVVVDIDSAVSLPHMLLVTDTTDRRATVVY